jgi:hypothetical protein
MTITLELPEASARQLASQAEAQGLSLSSYLAALVENALPSSLPTPKRLSDGEFRTALDSIAQFAHKIPAMPNETFSRQMIYQDHD